MGENAQNRQNKKKDMSKMPCLGNKVVYFFGDSKF